MDDLLGEFLVETSEQLDELDACLVRFEQNPNDAEMLKSIFRLAHTIKGTCGFFDLPRLAKLAHAAEALMSRYRDGAPVSAAGVTIILASLQRFKKILSELGRDGVEPGGNDDDLIHALEALAKAGDFGVVLSAEDKARERVPVEAVPESGPTASPVHGHLDALERAWQEDTVTDDACQPAQIDPTTDEYGEAREPAIAEVDVPSTAEPRVPALRMPTVRVAVDTLETLMTTVSELVLARNQLVDLATRSDVPAFTAPMQRLSAVTVELQDTIMKARLHVTERGRRF